MRADRLLATVLLLQARGRLTAPELAERLEVSVRTVYRDLDALSAAGVPVYATTGRNGGVTLPPGYRPDLTALRPAEARALFLGGAPGPLTELGVGDVLDGALRKLSAALPATARGEAERARQRLLVDSTDFWQGPARAAAHLRTVEGAVWGDQRLRISYARYGRAPSERVIDPYALVAKQGVWYLVGAVAPEGAGAAGGAGGRPRAPGRPGRASDASGSGSVAQQGRRGSRWSSGSRASRRPRCWTSRGSARRTSTWPLSGRRGAPTSWPASPATPPPCGPRRRRPACWAGASAAASRRRCPASRTRTAG